MQICGNNCDCFDENGALCRAIDDAPFPAKPGAPCPLADIAQEETARPADPAFVREDPPAATPSDVAPRPAALKTLQTIRALCDEICRLFPSVSVEKSLPTVARSYAGCTLQFPIKTAILSEAVRMDLSQLFALSDSVLVEANPSGVLYTFCVHIWENIEK